MQQTELIGREEELSRLKKALDSAIKGEGSTTFVSGEAGIGKTCLVNAFRELVAAQDVKVLNGAASAYSAQPFLLFSNALADEIGTPLFEEQEYKGFAKLFAVNNAGMLVAETSAAEEDMDADIFAGMLAAVQDFVRDSLDKSGTQGQGLGRLEYGNMKILIEHGEHIFLTAVFAGEEHPDMKHMLARTLAEIEDEHAAVLETWSGQMSDIAPVQADIARLSEIRFLVRRNLEGMNIEAERLRISDDILEVVKSASVKKPMIILLEDLHWADESSLFVLNYLARNIRDSPILLLGTLRPKESESLQKLIERMKNEHILDEMVLGHLELRNTVKIIDEMFRNNVFPAGLAERLFKQSKGNPLFVIEMLKSMYDAGSIARQNGRFTLLSDSYQIPATVEEVVNRRLEVLEPDTLLFTEYASCIGQQFDCDAAFSIQSLRYPLDAFGKAQSSEIIIRNNGTAEFSHAVFQSVIYDSVGERWKKGHHKNLGEYYENAYRDNPDEVLYELARHFSRTNEHEKCVDYCRRAGEKAEGSFAMEQALEFYNQSLKALSALDQAYARDKILELLERIGDIQAVMGIYDDAMENFRKVKEQSGSAETKSRVLRKSANILTGNGDFVKSLELTTEAREALEDANRLELGRIMHEDGTTYWRKGEFDKAMELFNEALDIFTNEPGIEERDIAIVLNGIGGVHKTRGELNDALPVYQRSLEMFEKIGNPKEIALLLGNVAGVLVGMGKLDEGLKYFNQSLEMREKIGDILGIAQTQNNLGVIHQDRGELDKALDAFQKSLEMAEKLGSKVGISIILYNIGNLYYLKGELERALDIYNRCLDVRQEIGDKQGLAYSLYILGRISNSKGDKAAAKQYYEESLAIGLEVGDKQLSTHPISSLAELMLEEGDAVAALEKVEKAVETSAEIGARGEEGRCRRILAAAHRELEELDKAEEELNKAKEILEEVGHREELAWVYKEYAYLRKAKGEPDNAKESLEKAISMFEEMGMKLWAGECRKALEEL